MRSHADFLAQGMRRVLPVGNEIVLFGAFPLGGNVDGGVFGHDASFRGAVDKEGYGAALWLDVGRHFVT